MDERRLAELRQRITDGGDRSAIQELVVEVGAWVQAIGRSMGLEPSECEDAMQEFLVRLWEDDWHVLRVWGREATLRGYLRVVARRIALEVMRRRGLVLDDSAHDPVAAGPGPREIAEKEERHRMLHSAMSNLSENDSQILSMRLLQDLSHEDIANRLQITLNAASVRLHRAERRLEAQLRRIASEDKTWN